ncbi:cold-shock protein [Rickettsiaceae bacterium]|nr:cold-shock protein [Rickettsiaceae bacterium]
MNTGKVKWFDVAKGYGFIEQETGGDDVFVHISEVEKAGYTNLNNDQAIKYELQTKHGKSSAIDLQLL